MNTPHFVLYAIGLSEEVRDFLWGYPQAQDERDELLQDVLHELESFKSREGYDPHDEQMAIAYNALLRSLELLREGV